MEAHEVTDDIMNEVDWKKDGEVGCFMSLVKITAVTLVLAVVVAVAYQVLAPALVNLWW